MNTIKDIIFADGVYTSMTHIFSGLQCGIIFSYIFKLNHETMKKMSRIELYSTLLLELFLMSVVIYWHVPILNYFGKHVDEDYERKIGLTINSNTLFVISFLVGNKSLSSKIQAIIDK